MEHQQLTQWDYDKLIKVTGSVRQRCTAPKNSPSFDEWEDLIEALKNPASTVMYERRMHVVDDCPEVIRALNLIGWTPADKWSRALHEYVKRKFIDTFKGVVVSVNVEVVDKVDFGI